MNKLPKWAIAGLAVAVLLIGYCAWNWSHWQRRAVIATGFGARVACSCRYIQGRELGSCKTDFADLPGMGLVHLSDTPEEKTTHASVMLLASRSARFRPGYGCMIDAQ